MYLRPRCTPNIFSLAALSTLALLHTTTLRLALLQLLGHPPQLCDLDSPLSTTCCASLGCVLKHLSPSPCLTTLSAFRPFDLSRPAANSKRTLCSHTAYACDSSHLVLVSTYTTLFLPNNSPLIAPSDAWQRPPPRPLRQPYVLPVAPAFHIHIFSPY